MRRLIVAIPLALVLCSCARTNQRHIGTWRSIVPGMGELTWAIGDKTIEMAATNPDEKESGQYTIDYARTPIELDITLPGKTIRCIMEFIDKDSFKVVGEKDPNEPRPGSFEPERDVILFTRIPQP